MITKNGDELTLIADISAKAVKFGQAGNRQRILKHEVMTIINSEGQELVVEIKIATKQFSRPAQFKGTGRPLTFTPHRA